MGFFCDHCKGRENQREERTIVSWLGIIPASAFVCKLVILRWFSVIAHRTVDALVWRRAVAPRISSDVVWWAHNGIDVMCALITVATVMLGEDHRGIISQSFDVVAPRLDCRIRVPV